MEGSNPCVWFAAPGKVEVGSLPVPAPAAGEVLLRTRRTLISSGTELSILRQPQPGSAWAEFAHFPRPSGYSHVGEVVEVSADVDRSWIGKRVASRSHHAAWATCEVPDLRLIPPEVSDEEATFATLAGVAMNGLRRARLTWGESAVIFGLGILGQLSARIASVAGAGPVFAYDLSPLRLSKLPEAAPILSVAGNMESALDEVKRRTSGVGADLAIEATGNPDVIPEEIRFLREQGRLLLLSSPRGATLFDFHDLCNRPSITIVGAHGFSQPPLATPEFPWTSKRNGDLFLDWIAAGRLSVRELITHRFSFQHATAAYALLAEGPAKSLGIILEWA
jgi:threonine dehydrogenase-like Zn-dependent dehydrogenase